VIQSSFYSLRSNSAVYEVGADFNIEASKHLMTTPSYYHFAFRTASGARGHGHNSVIAATVFVGYRVLTISDHSRLIDVLGITNNRTFLIYGNRPKIDCTIGPEEWKTALSAWNEVFYLSNRNGWTRNRLAIGKKGLNERTAINLYYERQMMVITALHLSKPLWFHWSCVRDEHAWTSRCKWAGALGPNLGPLFYSPCS
jgi:hypothetical protein